MASCCVMILNERGEKAGFLARGERAGSLMTGSAYRAYHYPTYAEAEAAAEHFCQEVRGVNLLDGSEYALKYVIVNDAVPQLV